MAGSLRPTLAETVAYLKEHGQYDKAAAITAVTGPRGYLLLKRSEEGTTLPLSLTVTAELKQAIQNAAEEFEVVLDSLAEEAYRLVMDGEWLPGEAVRNKGTKAVLQVAVDSRLRDQIQEVLPSLSEEAGYRITESNLVLSHICEELGIERPDTASAERLETRIPKSLVGHFHREAEARSVSLQEVVEDGIRGLLEGAWAPGRHPYMTVSKRGPREGGWSESERAKLSVPVDKELLAGLRAKAQELSAEFGYLVYPGAVVRAILTDRLGEPAE